MACWFVNLEPREPTVAEENPICDIAYDFQGLCSPVTVVLAFCHTQVRLTAWKAYYFKESLLVLNQGYYASQCISTETGECEELHLTYLD